MTAGAPTSTGAPAARATGREGRWQPTLTAAATAAAGPADAAGGIRSNEDLAGWLFVAPVIVDPRAVPAAAHPDGAVGQPHRLERPGQPVHRRRPVRRRRQLHPAVHRGRAGPPGLHDQHPQQLLLRGARGAGCRPCSRSAWRWSSTSGCSRARRFFRTRVLLPLGDQLGARSAWCSCSSSPTPARSTRCSRCLGIDGPQWFADPRGVLHLLFGAVGRRHRHRRALADGGPFGLTWWDWLAGPSVAMFAIITLVVWTTSGTFMLMFLAALQNMPVDARRGQHPRRRRPGGSASGTSPCRMLRPTLFLVLTLGLIGTWQVFDQVYVMSQGDPAKTTLTPAYLSYRTAFQDFNYGAGAAISFVLFLIIVVLTLIQRRVLRERGHRPAAPPAPRRRGGAYRGEGPLSIDADCSSRPAAADGARAASSERAAAQALATRFLGYAVAGLLRAGLPLPVRHPDRQRRSRPSPTRRRTRCHRFRTRSRWPASNGSSPAPTSRCGSATRCS